MIAKSTLLFLKNLKKNNNRDWFETHRKSYEEAKADFLQFLEVIIPKIVFFDPGVATVKAKDCIYRINRDIRFSKDKTPYKTHLGAYICVKGRQSGYPGYYVHIEPGNNLAGGGAFILMPDELKRIRQEIDYNNKEFLKIITGKKFKSVFGKLQGDMVKNTPKGYDKSNEMVEYLKYKNWYVSTPFTDTEMESGFIEKKVVQSFELLKPLNNFFQRALNE